jgi:hypothetical protein
VLVLAFLMIALPVFWKRMKAGRLLNEVRAEPLVIRELRKGQGDF